jgi:hypothetical protein
MGNRTTVPLEASLSFGLGTGNQHPELTVYFELLGSWVHDYKVNLFDIIEDDLNDENDGVMSVYFGEDAREYKARLADQLERLAAHIRQRIKASA